MPSPPELASEVVRIARAMAEHGLVAEAFGNVSAREGELVQITPSAFPYESMTPDDVVTLDLSGTVLRGTLEPSSERAVHLAIYAARPEVYAIVHTHSTRAREWSYRAQDLDTDELRLLAGGAVRTTAGGEPGSPELATAAVAALGDRKAALLARHGVVGVGATLDEALSICEAVEREAAIAWLANPG